MTLEESDHDPWFEEFEEVPDVLRPAFRLYGRQRRFATLEALASELGLRTDQATAATWQSLYSMLEPLAKTLRQGSQFWDERPIILAHAAADRLSLEQTARALVEFGWGDTVLERVCVRDLTAALRERLARNLVHHVQRMLNRWETQGLLAGPKPPSGL